MTFSPEELGAYIDGQCSAEAAQRIEQAVARDRELARRIASERSLRQRLRSHFAPIEEEPVPARWEAMVRGAAVPGDAEVAPVTDLAEVRARRSETMPAMGAGWAPRLWVGSAIAASLILGIFLGMQVRGGGPFGSRNGVLTAQGELAQALDTQLASASQNAPVRMLLTFRSRDGSVCRAFTGREASGVACRSGSRWQMRHVLPGMPDARTEYRQAGSANGELTALAQDMAVGDAFDARQELAARNHDWQ